MPNTTFMFRYRKAPLDTYHIMFVAALLCLAVLVLCAMADLLSGGAGTSNISLATMILAVVPAAGGWIYNRASDGRDESRGIQLSVVAMTACAVLGMVLHVYLVQGGDSGSAVDTVGRAALDTGANPSWEVVFWSVLVSIMALDAVLVGFVALLHSAIYHRLLNRPAGPDGGRSRRCVGRAIRPEVRKGVRMDTPQGRHVSCDYALWCKAIREYKESYGLPYGGGERVEW